MNDGCVKSVNKPLVIGDRPRFNGPVGINRNGKPVAVVISAYEYAQFEALKEAHLKQAIEEGIAELKAGKVSDGKSVIGKMHKRVAGKS